MCKIGNFRSHKHRPTCVVFNVHECVVLCKAYKHDRWFTVKCFYYTLSLKFNLSAGSVSFIWSVSSVFSSVLTSSNRRCEVTWNVWIFFFYKVYDFHDGWCWKSCIFSLFHPANDWIKFIQCLMYDEVYSAWLAHAFSQSIIFRVLYCSNSTTLDWWSNIKSMQFTVQAVNLN